ncbi:hypothetical protein GCM10023196_036880 [Actinoallomurus vinaceus]|uniref:SHOCT domain-containing protein n=1 Tax=Actinoallomurus vinaceus TaxID=1080074 RepID=A0ABP8UB58_9ACTN
MNGPLEAHGANGQLYFDGATVTLTRRGFMARSQVGGGEQRIPLTSISAVNWKPASKIGINGYIQFTVAGDTRRRPRRGQGNLDAARDQMSVTFRYGQMPAFEVARDAIEQALAAARMPAPAPGQAWGPPPPGSYGQQDPAARLRQLDALRGQGLISDQEYARQRAQIIGGV